MNKSTLYPFRETEHKWRQIWEDKKIFHSNLKDETKPTFSVVPMFPYPSGVLHMGHLRNYTATCVMSHRKRTQGMNVIHPIGFDSFGLPAENAAREFGVHPEKWTNNNIKNMIKQLKDIGISFNWDLVLSTCDESYYKQQLILISEFFQKGMLYQKFDLVNWDPVDKTVLANEQVINGKGWRSGAIIEKKPMKQWYIKITEYGEELLNSLDLLTEWPDDVKEMQRNWIGKKETFSINFYVFNNDIREKLYDILKTSDINNHKIQEILEKENKIEFFTQSPEFIFEPTFLAISGRHEFALSLIDSNKEINNFIRYESDKDNIGVFSGFYCWNHITEEILPLWICSYVPSIYKAVLPIFSQNKVERNFSIKNNIKIRHIIKQEDIVQCDLCNVYEHCKKCEIKYQVNFKMLTCGKFSGLMRYDVRKNLCDNNIFNIRYVYKLQDWCISRQRLWGCPIPFFFCVNCKETVYSLCKTNNTQNTIYSTKGNNLLTEINQQDWLKEIRKKLSPEDNIFNEDFLDSQMEYQKFSCPKCHNDAILEKDSLDTFVDSSWYFFRYVSKEDNKPINSDLVNKWFPIDLYVGGVEHAVLHLLYTRFFTKVLCDLGHISFREPIKKLFPQGMVCMNTYQRSDNLKFVSPDDLIERDGKMFTYDDVLVNVGSVEKMSKSKKNTISPDSILTSFGGDASRLFILSDSPLEKEFIWNENNLKGSWKFLNKIWDMFEKISTNTNNEKESYEDIQNLNNLLFESHKHIDKMSFNLFIADIRMIIHSLEDMIKRKVNYSFLREFFIDFIKTLAPLLPHICEEIFSIIQKSKEYNIYLSESEKNVDSIFFTIVKTIYYIEFKNKTIRVFIQNKFFGVINVKQDMPDKEIFQKALSLTCLKESSVKGFVLKREIINLL
jgi:leucyl-tRNA synthetase